jgi:hypothetical protein
MLLLLLPVNAPAQRSTVPLARILDGISRQVENFWTYLSAVTCTEALTQEKLGDKGKTLFQHKATYDYFVLLQSRGGEIAVDESRIEKAKKDSKSRTALLTTNGFSILSLIFHPMYQSRYEFTQLSDEVVDGRPLMRIGFRHVAGELSPSVLVLKEREYPLDWKGTVWVDPDSFVVRRIEAALDSAMEDVGLLNLSAQVSYASFRFNGSLTYWLPQRAVIEASTRRQHWRNTHLFSGYRRFDVETEVKSASSR